ncbi:NAD(P)/FAD-dependent oxidoreductase [Alicyclobacillus fodiniaquatilis]|uniref:NAD(P)/FAD-dependent oxidoreductase n=1 Tax=Alicyclobacillus fodiniaquatilis TaxID=1661150 RepID=A0ABW4JM64_9BACL
MSTQAEVIVIGGGVVGAAAAYQLARSQVKVTLIDADHTGKATAAGAGIVSPASSFSPPAPYYPLSYAAASHYPKLIAQLAEDGETDTGYEVVGGLYVAANEEEAQRLVLVERLLLERKMAGAPNLGTIARLDAAEAKAYFPALGEITGAIYMSDAARLNGRYLCNALKQAAIRRGANVVHGEARIACSAGRVSAVHVDDDVLTADAVMICGGAWSNQFGAATGIDIPITPQKGQILHLQMAQRTDKWPIIVGFHSHYMLTFPEHRVVVGATRETGSGYDTRVTALGMQELLREALRIAPGLGAGSIAEVRVGLRPASPDNMPVLGAIPSVDGLYVATGHGAGGLTTGAYSGIAVAERILGNQLIDLAPFSVARFSAR